MIKYLRFYLVRACKGTTFPCDCESVMRLYLAGQMPLLSSYNPDKGLNVFVWKMTESIETLEQMLLAPSAIPSKDLHPKRRKELLALHILMQTIGFKSVIKYLPNGKPIVSDDLHISISHCGDMAGFVFSDRPVGLDLQDDNPKLASIAKRFCSAEEFNWALDQPHSLTCFTLIWAAKEAVFKIFGEHVVFASEIRVKPFHLSNQLPLEVDCYRYNGWLELRVHRIHLLDYWLVIASL